MPRPVPVPILDAIRESLVAYPEGAGIEVLGTLHPTIPRRTLQRYLVRLVEMGRVRAIGRASARRYLLPEAHVVASPAAGDEARADWRSPGGMEVARLVRRPLDRRRPVGYHREFLDGYRPNRDHYLPEDLRAHLHAKGRSPDGERPAGTYARQVLDRLLIDLSWASSRLEGNTYTRLDTQNLIAYGRAAEGKDQREAQMILNHKAAIEMLVEDAESIAFNRYTLQNLHAILAENLLTDAGAEGRLRTIPVSISGTTYQPTAVPQLIEESFDRLLAKAETISDPFEQSFFVMVQLPYLQPFEDVNKRVSRLAANIPLIKRNLAPLSFVDIPVEAYVEATLGVYELNRVELLRDLYAWAYERSCQRYTVLRDALPAPDPLRLRYRSVLAELVRDTVRNGGAIDTDSLRAHAEPLVDRDDLDAVVAMAINELLRLHEGSIVRFGLRLAEFRAWSDSVRRR